MSPPQAPDPAIAHGVELLAHPLFDLARLLVRQDGEAGERRQFIRGEQADDSIVMNAINLAVRRMLDVQAIEPALGGERVRHFLESPDARSLVRQMYACQLSSEPVEVLEDEFAALFGLWTGVEQAAAQTHGRRLFRALMQAASEALQIAIKRNVLGAGEAQNALRHRILISHIESIERDLATLRTTTADDLGAAREFEQEYRRQVARRDSTVVPPNLDRNTKVPIDDLYVTPQLTRKLDSENQNSSLDYSSFLGEIDRTVILGDPGAGKSTLAIKICHDLATASENAAIYRGHAPTPILVVLRDYGAARKTDNASIVDFITSTARTKYQLTNVPDGAFDYMLRAGRVMVVFDGLDELLDSSYRQVVSGDVEAFAAIYPAAPILVTSRRIGYEQAPLDPSLFEAFGMAEFSQAQVESYASKWFALDTALTAPERKAKADGFVEESAIVDDLRSNPLMLGLMCNLYGGANYIPANRPDVYEKCAVMLFERWDRGRGINVELPFESRLRPAMQYLAHWIYLDEALQSGVTRQQLVVKATEYLWPRQFADEDQAREAANDFIDLCKGRAWVFTDTGLSVQDEPLFQFTHRTFLEYFCAAYLARTHNTGVDLMQSLLPYVAQREWDVVSQLAMQVKTAYLEDVEDEMISFLLESAKNAPTSESVSILEFAARSLEFLVPSTACVRALTERCINETLRFVVEAGGVGESLRPRRQSYEVDDDAALLYPLAGVGKETWTVVRSTLGSRLEELLIADDDTEAALTGEMAFHLEKIDGTPRPGTRGRAVELQSLGRDIVERHRDRIVKLAQTERLLMNDVLCDSMLPVSELSRDQVVGAIFTERKHRVFSRFTGMPAALSAFFGATSTEQEGYWWPRREQFEVLLAEIGRRLVELPAPWVPQGAIEHAWFDPREVHFGALSDNDARWAAFAVAAILIEGPSERGVVPVRRDRRSDPLIDQLAKSRETGQVSSTLSVEWSGLAQSQRELLEGWVTKTVDFSE